jgi:aminoglycoside 6'-N-acetyltransferase I
VIPDRSTSLGAMIEPCASVEQPGWLPLREALWPHGSKTEHLAEMAAFLAQPERFAQFVAYTTAHEPVGFVEASLRTDYVNGTNSSPVAFLEGLYVVPGHRRKGIARSLVAAVSEWAVTRGCRELASDAELGNELSHVFHTSLDFVETERVVFFRKTLSQR